MNFKKTTLKNGLRVITVPMKDNPTVTVLVLVEAGSKYETKRLNGLSHFLEHMCFKGTAARPKSIDISRELDGLGAESNAFTGEEYTGYYAKSDARHFRQVFDVVSDIYLNSTFPVLEMEREKGVIIEEINMYEDMPPRRVQDLWTKLLYGDQPAGWNIAGEKENIRRMKREDFVKYKKSHYVPKATIVVVAGQIGENDVLKEAQRTFGGISRARKSGKVKVKEKQNRPAILLERKKTDQAHLVLGFRAFDIFDKRNPALSVLSGILGGGMSSRLFQKMREELGICYYVRAGAQAFTDHGFFQVSAGVDRRRIGEAITAILAECRKLKDEIVTKEELDKAKEYIIGNTKLGLESTDDLAMFYGGQEVLIGKVLKAEEKFRKIKEVTARDIKKLANQIFKNETLNLAAIGPFSESGRFRKILKL